MKIRKAKANDCREIIRLVNEFTSSDYSDEKYVKRYMELLENGGYHIYLAEENKRIVGFVSFNVRFILRFFSQTGEIDELFIDKEFRKKGFGRRLMVHAINKMKKLKCNRIIINSTTDNLISHRLYSRLGFDKIGFYFIRVAKAPSGIKLINKAGNKKIIPIFDI